MLNYDIEFFAIRKIRELVKGCADQSEGKLCMEFWNEDPDSYHNQTHAGLFLEQYYSLPNRLRTPWGLYRIGGSGMGDWDPAAEQLVERFGAVVHRPLRRSDMGEFGPVYTLGRVDDLQLPTPVVRVREEFVGYHESLNHWNETASRLGKP